MSQTVKFKILLSSFVVFSLSNSVFAEKNTWKTAAIAVRCADNQWHLMDVTSEIDGHAEVAPALVGNLKEVSERVREWAPSWTDAIKASTAILINPGSFELPSYDTTNSPSAPTGCEARYLARYVTGSKTILFDRSLLNALPLNEQTLAKLRAQLSVVLDEKLTQDTLLVFRSLFQRKLDSRSVNRWSLTYFPGQMNLTRTWAGFPVVPRGEYLAIENRTGEYLYYAPIFIDSHWVTGKKLIYCREMSAFSLTTEKILKNCKLEFVSDGILGSNQNQKFLGLDERAFSGPFYLLYEGRETTIDFRRHMEQRGTYPIALIQTPWFDPAPLPVVKVVLSEDRAVSDLTFLMKPGQMSFRILKTPIEIESESNLVISLGQYGIQVKAAAPGIAQYHLKILGKDILVSGDSWVRQFDETLLSFTYVNSLSELSKGSILESPAEGCKIDAVADLLSSNLILKKASCTGSFTLKTSFAYSGTGSWEYGRDMWNGKVTREWWNLQEADGIIQSSLKFISIPGVFEASNYSLSPKQVYTDDFDSGKMSGSAMIFGKSIDGDKISWTYWHAEHAMFMYIDYGLEAGRLPAGIEQVGKLYYTQKGIELPTLSAFGRAKKDALLPCANGRTLKTEEGKEYRLTWYPSVAKFQIPAEACL